MVEDDVLREVRASREAYARLHNFDVRAMVADLRTRDLAGDWAVVRHPPRRLSPVALPAVGPNETLQQTGAA
jgi:hypothetical protein